MPDIPGRRGVVAAVADTLLVKPRRQEGVTDPDTLLAVSTELGKMKCVASPNRSKVRKPEEYVPYRVKNPNEGAIYKLKPNEVATPKGPIEAVDLDYMPLLSTVTQEAMVTKDILSGHQWNLSFTNWDKVYARVSPDTLGRNIIVAVIDKGCDRDHPDLQGSFAGGATFEGTRKLPEQRGREGHAEDGKSHGTCCTGIIAARCDNQMGIAGLAPGCRIMSIRVTLETAGELAEAIKFAYLNNAKVISISLASANFNTEAVRTQIRIAASKGVVICASAGNDSGSALSYPAADVKVIACSAITRSGKRCTTADWGLSADANYGPGLSVVAPGVAIPTTQHSSGPGGHRDADYAYAFEGTSATAPHVAALAAIILSMKPTLLPSEVRDIIENSAQHLRAYEFDERPVFDDDSQMPDRNGWNRQVGYGLIDFEAAIAAARQ